MWGDKYPRKPLTEDQQRENADFKKRERNAEAALARLYARLEKDVEALAKKCGLPIESEEGTYSVGGYEPHIAPVDEEALTPEQRKSWEFDKTMADMMRRSYTSLINAQAAMVSSMNFDKNAFDGVKTVEWRRMPDLATKEEGKKKET